MLSEQDNELITRVGPGTPMGKLMREYWIPAALSSEFVADGEPVRLMLLGEQLIGFRDSSGRVGVMDHRCPHRCASLFFGRNEQDGIRCVYHGWKFDVDGNCLEMPNVPAHQTFTDKVHAKAYKVLERAGAVWVYMGERAVPPPFHEFEALTLADDKRRTFVFQMECNWLQNLEGDIDTSHFGFLHVGAVKPEDISDDNIHRHSITSRTPDYQAQETEWGTMYTAYRPTEPGQTYYRFAHFMFPFFTFTPNATFKDQITTTARVPMDDNHTMVFNFSATTYVSALTVLKNGDPIPGILTTRGPQGAGFLPNTTDWFGRWRTVPNMSNDFLIDRDMQRNQSYTGILGIGTQDRAMTESMGTIVDRSFEHLAPSDRMIAVTRRVMLETVRAHQDKGALPKNVDHPEIAHHIRSGGFITSDNLDWLDAYEQSLVTADSHQQGYLKSKAAE